MKTDEKRYYHCNQCGEPIMPRHYSAHWTHLLPSQQKSCCRSPRPKEIDGDYQLN